MSNHIRIRDIAIEFRFKSKIKAKLEMIFGFQKQYVIYLVFLNTDSTN
jgi:hypothetical protein